MVNNSNENLYKVLDFIVRQPTETNLQYAIRHAQVFNEKLNNKDREYNAFYIKTYRFMQELQKQGLIEITKRDGLIWILPKDPTLLDLIRRTEKLKLDKRQEKTKAFFPKRCNELRKSAIRISLKKRMLDQENRRQIKFLFNEYVSHARHKVIILKRYEDAPTFYKRFLILSYRTRFTDMSFVRKQFKTYDTIFKIASQKYKNAVFLTLTTDPKRFKSAYHGWKNFNKATNRFMSFLKKRLKERPNYLMVYEFTESGLLHAHIIIFGQSYLLPKEVIVNEWKRCKQGEIVHITTLINDGGRWTSLSYMQKDEDKIDNLKGYLAKYLRKAMFSTNKTSLYFASNKRFISWSYRLYRPKTPLRESLGLFYFFCACFEWEIPIIVEGSYEPSVKWATVSNEPILAT